MTIEFLYHPVRPDYFVDPPEALDVLHFASGCSARGDLAGFSRLLYPVGVSIPDLSPSTLAELLALAHLPLDVFVDTGAFSEREFTPAGPRTVAPITEQGWVERTRIDHQIAAAFGPRANIVAPDCVGDQAETLRRLARYAEAMRACRVLGARVIVPIQRGATPAPRFDRACAAALGFSDYVRAIPGNKEAMSTREVRELVTATRPGAVHLLGVGPRSRRFVEFVEAVREGAPAARISCDSNLLAAHLGKSNGAGGRPRAITEASASMARADAIVIAFGGAVMFRKAIAAGLLGPPALFRGLRGGTVGFGPAPRKAMQLDLFDARPDAPPSRRAGLQAGLLSDPRHHPGTCTAGPSCPLCNALDAAAEMFWARQQVHALATSRGGLILVREGSGVGACREG